MRPEDDGADCVRVGVGHDLVGRPADRDDDRDLLGIELAVGSQRGRLPSPGVDPIAFCLVPVDGRSLGPAGSAKDVGDDVQQVQPPLIASRELECRVERV